MPGSRVSVPSRWLDRDGPGLVDRYGKTDPSSVSLGERKPDPNHQLERLCVCETARILEVNEDVVKTRLHRARLAVRQKLDGYLPEARRDATSL